MRTPLALPLLLVSCTLASGSPGRTEEIQDGMAIDRSLTFSAGTHRITEPLAILKDGVTVDFGGATLLGSGEGADPDAFTGVALELHGRSNVTIKNLNAHGFKVAIQASKCTGLVIEGCDVSRNFRQRLGSTPEREASSDWLWPHNNDNDEWVSRYGAGISIVDGKNVTLVRNRARDGQNGILLTRTTDSFVLDNDMSYLSGWGLGMYRSSRNEVSGNRFDYCVRGYSHGVYHRGQDSTGILVFEQCSDNVFARNSATHGGDGFFLYAGHETTQRTGKGGCNGNLVIGNDFSFAVANGIEATFSTGNRFVANTLIDCDYGVWAGYSYGNEFVANRIEGSLTAGIAIEHGHDNRIERNSLRANRRGIWLWWDEDKEFLESIYGKTQETDSRGYVITRNRFVDETTAVHLTTTADVYFAGNEVRGGEVGLHLDGACSKIEVEKNNFIACSRVIDNASEARISMGRNFIGTGEEGGLLPETPFTLDLDTEAEIEKLPEMRGTIAPFPEEGAPRGRATMVVDEWGPVDASRPRLFPARVSAFGEARIFVLGHGIPFRIKDVDGQVAISPSEGTAPATLVVTPMKSGLASFRIEVTAGDVTLTASGTVVRARWNVSFYGWNRVGPGLPPADWTAVLAHDPLRTLETDRLDFRWGGEGPAEGLPADHFATVAETEIELPAGTFLLRTVSDDGIRVIVDGKIVQEDWTWHAPKELTTELHVNHGKHRFRVEHFEIDGHAQLQVFLEEKAAGTRQ